MIGNAQNFDPTDPNAPPAGMRWDEGLQTWVPISTNPTGIYDYSPGPTGQDWQRPLLPPESPAAAPPPTGGGGGGNTAGSLLLPKLGAPPSPLTGPPGYVPATPEFHAPKFNAPAPYALPTMEEAANEPGYKFGVNEGERAIEQSAAARGALNGGGTLKDLLNYGRSAAEQNYGNVAARSLGTYRENVQNQNILPYQAAFQGAAAEFAPKMTGYSTQAAAGQYEQQSQFQNWLAQYYAQLAGQGQGFQQQFQVATA